LNRYMKYSKNYRLAIICLAIALATIVWVCVTAAVLFTSSSTSSVLGLDRMTATLTLFFVPIVTGIALMLGINFWYIAEGKRFGWYGLSESTENAE
jgi:hypothetical protein